MGEMCDTQATSAPDYHPAPVVADPARAALDQLRETVGAVHAAGALTAGIGHWSEQIHGAGRDLIDRLDVLGPAAGPARAAVTAAAEQATTVLDRYRAFPAAVRHRRPDGARRSGPALFAEPPSLRSPHAEAVIQLHRLAGEVTALSARTDHAAVLALTQEGARLAAVTALVDDVFAAAPDYTLDVPEAPEPAAAPARVRRPVAMSPVVVLAVITLVIILVLIGGHR